MYAEWSHQLVQILRFAGAFTVLMFIWPRLLFRINSSDVVERVTARFIQMMLLLIIMGYLLVATKLFEMLAILPLLCLLTARDYIWRYVGSRRRKEALSALSIKVYDWLDGTYHPREQLKAAIRSKLQRSMNELRNRIHRIGILSESMLLLFVIAVSGYIRFYDALVYAAPTMSDGYVTLAWVKYIDQRLLFHDGIYPQGFHIWLTYLVKFSALDPLYILKYVGPLNAMLLMLGMYIAVSRWTGNRMAGMIAVAVYGLLGSLISGSAFERQASTNSQEFAFVFVFIILYFLHRWLRDRMRWSLWTGIAGMSVVGLVHTLAYVYLGIGVALLLLIYIPLTYRERFRPLWPVIAGGAASVGISAIPLLTGLLLGRSFHSSSENFATARNFVTLLPELKLMDMIALLSIALMWIWIIAHSRRIREFTGPLFASMFAAVTFAVYYWGSTFSFPGSIVITARSNELWAMAMPVALGTAWGVLFRSWTAVIKHRFPEMAAAVVVIALCLSLIPPKPVIPYKMEWDSGVEQYLKISSTYRPKTWMIVSHTREGYALVLGRGIHMDTSVFLNRYDPERWPLTLIGESSADRGIPKDIFVYYQKSIYRVEESNSIYPIMEPEYVQRQDEMQLMEHWITLHRAVNPEIAIWYEDENLRIYHIHNPSVENREFEQIWGRGERP